MIKHILNRAWNERRANYWIGLELLLISICLWFAVDFLYVKIYTYNQPLGFDIAHTYEVKLYKYNSSSYLYKEETKKQQEDNFNLILDRIKQDSTVETICLTNSLNHYQMGFVTVSFMPKDSINKCSARFYSVSADYFNVFRVKSKYDNSHQSLSDALTSGGVVITPAAEQLLFKDNSAIGKTLYAGAENPIKAVCTAHRFNEFGLPLVSVYELIKPEEIYNSSIYIRVKPSADGATYAQDFNLRMKEHLSLGNTYLYELVSVANYRKSNLKESINELQTAASITFFFLINIFLGILGTFWFRTRQRKAELGLRIALGSNRMQLGTLLIGEGIILLTMAFIPSIAFSFNIAYAELVDVYLMPFSGLRFAIGLGITYLLLVITIVLGIWIPAQQAIKVSPTEALHNT